MKIKIKNKTPIRQKVKIHPHTKSQVSFEQKQNFAIKNKININPAHQVKLVWG